MGMSSGGNEGLFKLAETAAPDENRIMPADRVYLKTDRTVTINEALAQLKNRRQNPTSIMEGGLDDNRPEIVSKTARKNTVVSNPETSKDNESISSTKGRGIGKRTAAELVDTMNRLEKSISSIENSIKNKSNSQPDEKGKDILTRFKQERHKVTFEINGMEFTVTCLGMITDPSSHTLVITFEENSESFFVPPAESELAIKYDGARLNYKLFYFGMCFTIKELGLRFLGFLYDTEPDINSISSKKEV